MTTDLILSRPARPFIGEEMEYSPIRVERFRLKPGTKSRYLLAFFHLNYPEGVQNKEYALTPVEWGARFLLARTPDSGFAKLVLLRPMTWTWLEAHFPKMASHARSLVPEGADAEMGIQHLTADWGLRFHG